MAETALNYKIQFNCSPFQLRASGAVEVGEVGGGGRGEGSATFFFLPIIAALNRTLSQLNSCFCQPSIKHFIEKTAIRKCWHKNLRRNLSSGLK